MKQRTVWFQERIILHNKPHTTRKKWTQFLVSGKSVDVVYVDFGKLFNKILRKRLFI